MIKSLYLLSCIILCANTANSAYAATFPTNVFNLTDTNLTENTIWDGTSWSNGIPNQNTEIVVRGPFILSESLHVKKVTIESQGSVIIPAGINLTVTESLINHAGAANFIVEHGGNFIQINADDNIGEITVKKNSTPMVRNDMTFWSSPVSGQSIRQFSPETLYNRFWTYNESTDLFSEILTSNTDAKIFENGLGYSIRVRNTLAPNETTIQNGQFVGVPFNGNLGIDVVNNNNGFNLIGNPYSSDVDLTKFFNANPQVKGIYLWTHKYSTSHLEYDNNYEVVTKGGSEALNYDRIKVGEGFLVLIDENNVTPVTFTNEMRTIEVSTKDRFWLQLSSDEGVKNQINIAYIDNVTDGYDINYDKTISSYLTTGIYSVVDEDKLVINAKSLPFTTSNIVKLGFKARVAGNYTINIASKEGLFDNNQTIYIKDYLTETLHNLSSGSYSFTSNAGDFNDRFEIVFIESSFMSTSDVKNSGKISVYNSNEGFVIQSSKELIKSVEIIDVLGRKINFNDTVNSNQFKIKNNLKGVYVLKITDVKGNLTIKKISN